MMLQFSPFDEFGFTIGKATYVLGLIYVSMLLDLVHFNHPTLTGMDFFMTSQLGSSGKTLVASFKCTRESILASVCTHVMSKLEFLGKCFCASFPCTLDHLFSFLFLPWIPSYPTYLEHWFTMCLFMSVQVGSTLKRFCTTLVRAMKWTCCFGIMRTNVSCQMSRTSICLVASRPSTCKRTLFVTLSMKKSRINQSSSLFTSPV